MKQIQFIIAFLSIYFIGCNSNTVKENQKSLEKTRILMLDVVTKEAYPLFSDEDLKKKASKLYTHSKNKEFFSFTEEEENEKSIKSKELYLDAKREYFRLRSERLHPEVGGEIYHVNQVVRSSFNNSGLFDVISNEDQKKALDKIKDCSTSNCAIELGKVLFAKLILSGKVFFENYTYDSACIVLKITDVQKGLYAMGYQKCYLIPKENVSKTIQDMPDKFDFNWKEITEIASKEIIENYKKNR